MWSQLSKKTDEPNAAFDEAAAFNPTLAG